jgi:dethiobiotin synthetase
MKPVATGATRGVRGEWQHEDVIRLQQVINLEETGGEINPYCFEPPISPNIAARQAGREIRLEAIRECARRLEERADLVVVEGVGGWRTPLSEQESVADLARILDYPVILVVGLRLGCINQGRLSAETIARDGLPCLGWIGNGLDPGLDEPEEVIATLRRSLPVPCLGILPYVSTPDFARLAQALQEGFDGLAGRP